MRQGAKLKTRTKPVRDDLITQSEAARLRGMSLAAVNEHVRSGRWRSEFRYGKRLVYKADVDSFEPKTHKAKHRGEQTKTQTRRKPKANRKQMKRR
jgi:hypothetical protein